MRFEGLPNRARAMLSICARASVDDSAYALSMHGGMRETTLVDAWIRCACRGPLVRIRLQIP